MKRKYMFGIVFLFLTSLALAITQTGYLGNFVQDEWNTSNSIENITFVGGDTQTLYVNLPKNINVTFTQLNVTSTDELQNVTINISNTNIFEISENILSNRGINSSENYYIMIKADDVNKTELVTNQNNVSLLYPGTWIYWNMNTSYDVSRAKMMYTLFNGFQYGRAVTGITNPTELKTPDQTDVGKRGHYMTVSLNVGTSPDPCYTVDGTFENNLTNNNVSSWSSITSHTSGQNFWRVNGTIMLMCTGLTTCEEFNKDLSADERTNPLVVTQACSYPGSGSSGNFNGAVIVLANGNMSWSVFNGAMETYDFFNNASIPEFTEITSSDFFMNQSYFTNSFTDSLNTLLEICSPNTNGYCNFPFYFYSDTAGVLQTDIGNSINYTLMYNFSYNEYAYDESQENYNITIFNNDLIIDGSLFNYNSDNYTPTQTDQPSYTYLERILTSPFSSNYSITYPMYWLINTTFGLFQTITYLQSYNPTSLSITTYDENTEIFINQSVTFLIFSDTYSNSNTSVNGNYTFVNLPSDEYQLDIYSSGYNPRNYILTVGNGTTQYLNAYLTNSTDSTIFTITNFDSGEVIEDVSTTMYRYINNSWTPISIKTSDVSGKLKFYYSENINYRFLLTKDGYEDKLFYLNPILFNSYDVKMNIETLINYSQDFDGISIVYDPQQFYNNELTTFNFLISSPDGALTQYGFNISFPGGSEVSSGTNAIGEQLSATINITDANIFDFVILNYYYDTTLSGRKDFTTSFPIIFENGTQSTFMMNKDEHYGMTMFERILIVTFIVILVVGIAALIGQVIPGLALGLIVMGYCVFIGFIPIWSVLISIFIGIFYLTWKSGL